MLLKGSINFKCDLASDSMWLYDCIQYLSLLSLLLFLFSFHKKKLEDILIVVLLIYSIFESGWGILQILGFAGVERHRYFILLGSFKNPGPYGGMIGTLMAVALACVFKYKQSQMRIHRVILILSYISLALGALVLPASRSRSGWVAFIVSAIILLYRDTYYLKYLFRHKAILWVVVPIMLLFCVGSFYFKKDSAIGRLHLWNMELKVIGKYPVSGVGADHIFKAFGEEQKEYFRTGKGNETIARIAECPSYTFNEYLKFGMSYGVMGLLSSLLLALFVVCTLLKARSVISYGAIAFAIFAFASFPLSTFQFRLLFIVILSYVVSLLLNKIEGVNLTIRRCFFLVISIICLFVGYCHYSGAKSYYEALRVWKSSSSLSEDNFHNNAVLLKKLYPMLKSNKFFLTDYALSLSGAGCYEESNQIIREGLDMVENESFHTLMAYNLIALGDYKMAEEHLYSAHWLMPCRINPLLMLMKLYLSAGREEDAIAIGNKVKGMDVNRNNALMVEKWNEAMSLLDAVKMNNKDEIQAME